MKAIHLALPYTTLVAATALAMVTAAVSTAAWLRERRRRFALEARANRAGASTGGAGAVQPTTPLPAHAAASVAAPSAPEMGSIGGATQPPAVPVSARHDASARHEEMLRRSERLASLGRMLAGTAHELNNPLAAVCGFAQLLLRGNVSEEQRQALETIDREATRAAAVVRDLLTFARHHHHETPRPVDLNAIARYVVGTRQYSVSSGGVSLELELAPGTLPVHGVATQLEQVVLNLVSNAEQALEAAVDARAVTAGARGVTGQGVLPEPTSRADAGGHTPLAGMSTRSISAGGTPRVLVRTSRAGNDAVLQVIDSGPGIPENQLPLIWDPFWTTRADSEGTGLGLPVVHEIVSAHHGTVEVDSRPGNGTSFTVSLPLSRDTADDHTVGGHGTTGSTPDPLDVLVLGMDGDGAFLTRLLGARGHAVVTAPDAEHAMRLAATGGFDVVMADAAHLDAGEQLWLRDLGERMAADGRHTRIVLVTEPTTPAATGGRVRASATLTRPFDVDALRRAVERG